MRNKTKQLILISYSILIGIGLSVIVLTLENNEIFMPITTTVRIFIPLIFSLIITLFLKGQRSENFERFILSLAIIYIAHFLIYFIYLFTVAEWTDWSVM